MFRRSLGTVFVSLSKQARAPTSSGCARNLVLRTMCSEAAPVTYNYETMNVTRPSDFVVHVEINRPEKRNAMNKQFYSEILECFKKLTTDEDCRAIVLSGAGKIFTSGIDIMDLAAGIMSGGSDPGKKAMMIRNFVFYLQECYNVIEKCPKPVIAAIHGACIGGGVDMTCACDIRYATSDAYIQIKEVELGLAADLGTLQRFPKIVGNESYVRELAFTTRKSYADEAKEFGYISRVFESKEQMMAGALETASTIASKSPVAVQGSKVNLIYARDHSVQDGMDFVATWNQGMLQSEDTMKAATAMMQKEKPVFSKL